jgi:hypothetical protein
MGQIYVFNKLKWKPPIASKLLTTPELELNLYYPDDEIKPMPGKQRTIFDAKFKSYFDPKFNATSTTRMKQIQDAVKWTEERIVQKATVKEKEEVVDTANKLLKQAFDSWQGEIQKLCDECVMKAFEDSIKAMKMKLVKAQIKSVAKIVLLVALVLTAAGLAIAVTVASHGALAPLIIGAIATGAGALWKAYKIFDSEWANSSNKIKEIQADIKLLEAAIEKYKKAEKSYAGTADKAKAFIAGLQAPVSAIDKHVGQLDKYIFEMQQKLKEQKAKLAEIQKQATNQAEVASAVKTCEAAIDKANDSLAKISEASKAAAEVKKAYAAQKIPDYGLLNSVVVFAQSNSSTVQQVGSALGTCMSSLKKLGVAIPT